MESKKRTLKMTYNDLREIQNENGGGLSTSVTGKYTSVRHELAKMDGKLTAGEAAKKVSKILSQKISAKELVAANDLLGRRTEWHHAGFYKSSSSRKSTMGRTFFFDGDDVAYLVENWEKVSEKMAEKIAEEKRKKETIVKGWFVCFKRESINRFGKLGYKPYLGLYEGTEDCIPNHFTLLSDGEFLSAKLQEGRRLEAYESPKFESISKIKYNRILKARAEAEEKRKADAIAEEERLAKMFEENRLHKLAKIEAKKQANPTNFIPYAEEINTIKEWVIKGCVHPCPNNLLALKQKSGLNWNQFTSLSKNLWSGWIY